MPQRYADTKTAQMPSAPPSEPPAPRWTLDETGKRVRLFTCRLCQDVGMVITPYTPARGDPWPTPEECYNGGIVYPPGDHGLVRFCPGCRGSLSLYAMKGIRPGEQRPRLSDRHMELLECWVEGREAWLDRAADRQRAALDLDEAAASVAHDMPDAAVGAGDNVKAELETVKARMAALAAKGVE